jgi:menaquinone-dependent protoporphyrinogen oxidase
MHMQMTVLVTAASKHGATWEIAERIADVLRDCAVSAELRDIRDVVRVDQYDAVVLGSGIYLGQWLEDARKFLERFGGHLTERKTWLFSSGSIVGDPPAADDPNALRAGLVDRLLATTQAREHKLFAGKLDKSQLGLLEKAAVRGAHASEGDFRDWDDIDRWARAIAAEVRR